MPRRVIIPNPKPPGEKPARKVNAVDRICESIDNLALILERVYWELERLGRGQ